ncbi:pentapeptide repeat-containing protein [Pseudomonas sp. S3E12]|uniref:pentapeptide repeat-containing protein n=1 Tax=Pseudomonas sp. S3E12 TaxID=1873126 RepID=UPI0009F17BE7|nr:pentapeptide repeat-containing protein [Pseudomonas sp. S3E12]
MQGLDLDASLNVSKPKSLLNTSLKLDAKALAVSLAKGVGHALLGKFDDLADDGVDAASAIGFENKTPEQLLYRLLQRSTLAALSGLLLDSKDQLPEQYDFSSLEPLLEEKILTCKVNNDFFKNPVKFQLINSIKEAIFAWLVDVGVSQAKSHTISSRLPGYFPHALHKEWQSNSAVYQEIIASLNSPFSLSVERELSWRLYDAQLQRRLEESVFGEPFGLRQIYIPLNAYYEECPVATDISDNHMSNRKIAVRLNEELDRWLLTSKKEDAVRAISGGPGSGKSSFSKIYAAHVSKQGRIKVLFIPLHYIDPSRDFAEEVGRFLSDEGIIKINPLKREELTSDLLIILDGLDELASQGRAAAETARDFVRSVQLTVDRINMNGLCVRVLLSGREVTIQGSESELRQVKQVLTVLPYYTDNSETSRSQSDFEDPKSILSQDLRADWWRNYGGLTGLGYSGLPEDLKRADLDEITAQPLLNYLLALSYCRGKLNFSKGVNLNQIYDDLVEAIYERGYENGRRHGPIKLLKEADFFLILEEIGLAAWHGDGRTTTISEIEHYCELGGLKTQLNVFQEGAEAGITSLLAAFFFRQHGSRPKGDPTFIFTHKSFGEYLTARRLVRAMREIVEETHRRQGRARGWGEAEALAYWVEMCGPAALSKNIHDFLRSEVKLQTPLAIDAMHKCFVSLFNYILANGMPMEKITKLVSFPKALFQARNAEEALFAAMNACALASSQISDIVHTDKTAFGTWLKRIQEQRSGPEHTLVLSCMSWLNLSGLSLDLADFYAADISNSNFEGANGFRIVLGRANGTKTNFKGVSFNNAFFCLGDFEGANFEGARLQKSNFDNTTCTEANFSGSNLSESTFYEATVMGAIFAGADITGVEFALGERPRFKNIKKRNKTRKIAIANDSSISIDG